MTNKRKPERSRWLLNQNPLLLLLLLLLLPLVWLFRPDPAMVTLGYGEFKQVLQAPGVRFHDVKVGKSEIHGSLLLRDHLSGPEKKEPADTRSTGGAEPIPFRTPPPNSSASTDRPAGRRASNSCCARRSPR